MILSIIIDRPCLRVNPNAKQVFFVSHKIQVVLGSIQIPFDLRNISNKEQSTARKMLIPESGFCRKSCGTFEIYSGKTSNRNHSFGTIQERLEEGFLHAFAEVTRDERLQGISSGLESS